MAMSSYQEFIHRSRYARWLEEEGRRETWEETVHRYTTFFQQFIPKEEQQVVRELEDAILDMQVMPSMRAMMTAGPALSKDNAAGYNCSYIAVDDPRAFDEAMYLSMCGTGVGFSVERQYVNQMPIVSENFYPSLSVIRVKDSKIGWASSLKELIQLLYAGLIPQWDLSAIRPKGAPLKTFGGRASGPQPLEDLFKFCVATFQKSAGRKLTSIECHDIMCKIADVVVSGGVRRSAMISLSNLSDDRMRAAKTGQWWNENVQRALANNSAVYTEKPDIGIFMKEWLSLYESKSGERGIFNRAAATKQAKRTERRKWEGYEFGTNPCGEIILRSKGFCNLTEVVVRADDTLASLKKKIQLAVILGTLQSTLTSFRYLRKDWQKNAEEERLLGVSLTGLMDNRMMSTNSGELSAWLTVLKEYAIKVNAEWAQKLGISPATAITCIKPSGTVSQLVDCSPGIHMRWSRYLMKAVRNDKKDPLGALLKDCGVPNEPDVTKENDVDVFFFPLESPKTSVTRNDRTALEQLELYLTYKRHWCEHNPSCTIYVKESEWLKVGAWVYEHFDEIGGISFLPHTEHAYRQPPLRELTQQEYEKALADFPEIDWDRLPEFETTNCTEIVPELACSAGTCEVGASL
jgi:ribonucleoside-diphosphate reductase alpha chain